MTPIELRSLVKIAVAGQLQLWDNLTKIEKELKTEIESEELGMLSAELDVAADLTDQMADDWLASIREDRGCKC